MKIAVASTNGQDVSPHFGRSACFVVFDLHEGLVNGREVRPNAFTAHALGQCHGHGHGHGEGHGHGGGHGMGHGAVVAGLSDCSVLLCGGMGRRAAVDLQAAGIAPHVVPPGLDADAAVAAWMKGALPETGGFCGCGG